MKLDPGAFESEAPPADDNLLVLVSLRLFWMSRLLETGADETLVLNGGDNMGGFFVTLCPTLDPLEELRLAGARMAVRVEFDICDDVAGFLILGTEVVVRGTDFWRGIALTVLVETVLLIDERELLRLVFELLLSTSNLLLRPLNVVFRLLGGTSEVLNRREAILFGVEFKLRDGANDDVLLFRNDRLRSRDC